MSKEEPFTVATISEIVKRLEAANLPTDEDGYVLVPVEPMSNQPENTCPSCGAPVTAVATKGRTLFYRNQALLTIPEDFPIPTCSRCGAWWLDGLSIDTLSTALETQFEEWKQRLHPKDAMDGTTPVTSGVGAHDGYELQKARDTVEAILAIPTGPTHMSKEAVECLNGYLAVARFHLTHIQSPLTPESNLDSVYHTLRCLEQDITAAIRLVTRTKRDLAPPPQGVPTSEPGP